jgi:hypothetical protein
VPGARSATSWTCSPSAAPTAPRSSPACWSWPARRTRDWWADFGDVLPAWFEPCLAGGTFTILRFAERDVADVVYVEQLTGATYADKPDTVDCHRDVVNRLAAAALAPAATADFLAGMLREL